MPHFDSRFVDSNKKTSKNVFRHDQVSAVALEEKTHIGPKVQRPDAGVIPNFKKLCDRWKRVSQGLRFPICKMVST